RHSPAKGAYGPKPVSRVRIPASPPMNCGSLPVTQVTSYVGDIVLRGARSRWRGRAERCWRWRSIRFSVPLACEFGQTLWCEMNKRMRVGECVAIRDQASVDRALDS